MFLAQIEVWRQSRHVPELFSNRADIIFTGGNIYTMDVANPVVEAVAVKGKKVLFAGSEQQTLKFKYYATRVINLRGRTMLPSFVEPHVHLNQAYLDKWYDLGPFVNATTSDVKEKLIESVKKAEELDEPCMCRLYDPLITPGEGL